MLRVLIVSGLLLMTVGFGAAGWQYWTSLQQPAPVAATPDPAPTEQSATVWLVSDTGAVIPKDIGRIYLEQDRLVPGRSLVVTRTAPLSALLGEGETLPETDYLEVMADIRAPRLAEGICPVLAAGRVADCAMNSARVVPGSVDPAAGTARFRLEFAYRLRPEEADMPDPTTRVYRSRTLVWSPATDAPPPPDLAGALAALAAAADEACLAEEVGDICRIVGLELDWMGPTRMTGEVAIAWLDAFPEGMQSAPSLTPAP